MGMFDHASGLGKERELLALPRRGQAGDRYAQGFRAVNQLGARHRDSHFLRLCGPGRFEQFRVRRRRRLRRHTQRELALLRDAHVLAHQPLRRQLDVERVALEAGRDRHRHRQQQLAVVAVVHQRAHRQALGRGPRDLACGRARTQLPIERGRQARVARVLPVGVPLGLVLDSQAEPHGLAGHQALRRVRHQLGAHLVALDDGRLCLCRKRQDHSQQEGEKWAHHGIGA
jgi:hypothetical protein